MLYIELDKNQGPEICINDYYENMISKSTELF